MFVLIAAISFINVYFYQSRELPQKLPPKIESFIKKEALPGESVFLYTAMLDYLIFTYPELNLYPGGGDSRKSAAELNSFWLITNNGIPKEILSLKSEKVLELCDDGICLLRFKKKGGLLEYRASSFVEQFSIVSDDLSGFARWENGVFKTGHSAWQEIKRETKKFNGKFVDGVSAHPLESGKSTSITIPAQKELAGYIVFAGGVSDSGKCGKCPPVKVLIKQDDLSIPFVSSDGAWKELSLPGFVSNRPIQITFSAEESGKRHFSFDLIYRVKNGEK